VKKILIINTGGTFNKIYNSISGELYIDISQKALRSISEHWINQLDFIDIINKDSLNMDKDDRKEILQTIKESNYKSIIIVHGTDTIDKTAQYLDDAKLKKEIVLTGAMIPFSINPIESTANLTSAYGYLQGVNKDGVYIVLNGKMGLHSQIKKNREKGFFEKKETPK